MDLSSALAATITILFLLIKVSGGENGIVDCVEGDAMAANQHDALPLLMDALDKHYTPQCLRVIIVHQESYGTRNASSHLETHDRYNIYVNTNRKYSEIQLDKLMGSKPTVNIIFNAENFNQIKNTFQYIIRKVEKVSMFSCVTYMMSQQPDSRLLPFLSLSYYSMRLARYFFIYTQTSTEAEQFLLDQRLGKEENVAALVQEESQNKSYWRVLIRQLLHPSGSPQVLTVNRWSRDTGLTSTENIFPEQMANFHSTKLIGTTLDFIPFVDYEKTEGSLIVELKPSVDKFLLDVVAKKLNFTYDIVMPPDGQWGVLNDEGHFIGVVGEVEFGRANFSLDLSLTYERAKLLDYTVSYYIDAITFITAKNRPNPAWRKLLTPFRTSVWLCVLVSVGGGSLLYHIIYHAQATFISSRLLSSRAFMNIMASFLSQSLHRLFWLQAGKVFLGFWFLYSFLVTSYYKTSLTSTLAVPFAPSTIDTLQELLQSDLTYGIQARKGADYMLFATSEVPIYEKMFQEMEFHSTEDNLRKVAGGEYSYIYWKNTLETLVAMHNNNPKRKTELHRATEEFFPVGYAWVLPKGAPYKKTFDGVIKQCLYAGLIDKWVKDSLAIFTQRPRGESGAPGDPTGEEGDDRTDDNNTRGIVFTLNHLQGPFFLLFLGSGAGCAVLLVELLLGRGFKSNT